jgi:hypothetical protein
VAKFVCTVRNICILIGKKWAFGIPNWIFCDSRTELFKTHKTRMNRIRRSSAIHGRIKMERVALDTLNLVFICCGLHCSSYVYFLSSNLSCEGRLTYMHITTALHIVLSVWYQQLRKFSAKEVSGGIFYHQHVRAFHCVWIL